MSKFYDGSNIIDSYTDLLADGLKLVNYEEVALLVSKTWVFKSVQHASDRAVHFSECLSTYVNPEKSDTHFIVDTIYTSGKAMELNRAEAVIKGIEWYHIKGIVLFAFATPPSWITPLFKYDREEWNI